MTLTQSIPTKIPFWRKIRWNLIAYFLVLAVLPLSIVEAITISQTSDQARQQVIAQYETVAELKRDQIAAWLQEGRLTLDLIVADTVRQSRFATLLNNTSVYDPVLQQEALDVLSGSLAAQSLFEEFLLYDTSGRVMASTVHGHIGRVISSQPYFAPSLEGNYIQPPFHETRTSTAFAMFITRPIVNEGIVGALAGRLNLDTLAAIMTARINLGSTGETYLVSGERGDALTPTRFQSDSTAPRHSDGIERALGGENGAAVYASYHNPQVTVIGVYRWLPELNAALLAEVDDAEAMAAFIQARDTSVALALAAALAAIGVGLFSANRISQPITELTRVAGNIAAGDLTQRAALRQTNEIGILASAFNQMTEKLGTNIQELRQATAVAQESVRLKSEFINNMSHELRTPLTAIIGFCGIMLEGMGGEVDDEARHMLERMNANGVRLLNLINEILDLAKIEAGRMELVSVQVSPHDLADQWHSQMQALARQKNLSFEVHVDPTLPATLYADPERVTQIAVNLLGNAFKFTEAGSVRLDLTRDDAAWLIQVSDTGIGIAPHAINYIFDEFRQVDGSSQRVYGGSGLGLAIVKNLCQMMRGSVRCTSELGKGSVFTVTLPLVTSSEPELVAPRVA
jgi:signal transduction histidine kinase